MKEILLLPVFILYTLTGFSQSQGEMNQNAANNFNKADKELNKVYQQVLTKYKSDTAFIRNFKKAQRLWIQLRDAEVNTMYPEQSSSYGSVYPMCVNNYMAELTVARTRHLRLWLEGTIEGDVCSGAMITH